MRKEDIMSLGEKIADLRKRDKMSQEELAEKVGVARQTISKWELDETSPDIKQAQELSRIFNISLDELVGNEISNIVVEKISNTEKLAGMIIKILKVAGIVFLTMIVIELAVLVGAIFFFSPAVVEEKKDNKFGLNCVVDENRYVIEVAHNGIFNCHNCDKDLYDKLEKLMDFDNYEDTKNNIMEYFDEEDIQCELKEY